MTAARELFPGEYPEVYDHDDLTAEALDGLAKDFMKLAVCADEPEDRDRYLRLSDQMADRAELERSTS